jgi:hypothetical protein
VEYMDEASSTVAKDALHNYKLDGENKIKVNIYLILQGWRNANDVCLVDYIRKEVDMFRVSIHSVHCIILSYLFVK